MISKDKFIIITTINPISQSIKKIRDFDDYHLIIVGDKKTPPYENEKLFFLDVESQEKLPFKSITTCPYNAYQRKNIGYLYAISKGAKIIAETDDDNTPLQNWGKEIQFEPEHVNLVISPNFFNIYSEFTNEKIWPRGFPLENILPTSKNNFKKTDKVHVGIWQGLVNGDPDVDAIYRLIEGKNIQFKNKELYVLSKNVFCPFNSQNTFWEENFFPYLYLPITVSFRMTDILRGYVAQRCLWEHDAYLGFTGPTMDQNRNEHDLMQDFIMEIPCYTSIKKIVNILSEIHLSKSTFGNLKKIYSEFLKNEIVRKEELTNLENWISDIKQFS